MKVLITEICRGKPDGVHELVFTDGREYDLPEELAKRFVDEGKATTPPNPLFIKEHPSGYKGEPNPHPGIKAGDLRVKGDKEKIKREVKDE